MKRFFSKTKIEESHTLSRKEIHEFHRQMHVDFFQVTKDAFELGVRCRVYYATYDKFFNAYIAGAIGREIEGDMLDMGLEVVKRIYSIIDLKIYSYVINDTSTLV